MKILLISLFYTVLYRLSFGGVLLDYYYRNVVPLILLVDVLKEINVCIYIKEDIIRKRSILIENYLKTRFLTDFLILICLLFSNLHPVLLACVYLKASSSINIIQNLRLQFILNSTLSLFLAIFDILH
jgi:hypothetical protein